MGIAAMTTESTRTSLAPPDTAAGRMHRPLALGVLSGALALDIGSLNIVNPALPKIGAHFGLTDAQLQWTMTAYAIAFGGFLLLGGRLADVYGRRGVFAAGIALFTVAALGAALAPNLNLLIVARAVQGVGAALCGPSALALLTEIFPAGPARNRAFGVYAAVGAASGSAGFVLGGALTEYLGWRSVFLVAVAFGVIVLAGVKSALPAGVRHPQSLDLPGAAAVTAGMMLAVFGASDGSSSGWVRPAPVASLVAAVVLLVAFLLRESRVAQPLLPLSIFRAVPVRAGALAAFLQMTTAVGLQFFAPLYLQGILGYSPLRSGLAVLPLSLSAFGAARFAAGRLMSRYGQRPVLVAGLLLIGGGVALWADTGIGSSFWTQMMPGLIVMGVGIGITVPTMTASALTGVSQQRHGVAGAFNVTAQQMGAGIGVATLVVVADAAGSGTRAAQISGFHDAYITAAIGCLLGALVIAAARRWTGGAQTQETV
jgi:EmrB/QacA subfamily drug resistance transporter